MKEAETKRIIEVGKWRWRFDDGVAEVDAAKALRSLADQQVAKNGLLDPKPAIYRAQADRLYRRAISAMGTQALRDRMDADYKDLDDKIRSCLVRGDKTRLYVKQWAAETKTAKKERIDEDTVRRRIKWVKEHPTTTP